MSTLKASKTMTSTKQPLEMENLNENLNTSIDGPLDKTLALADNVVLSMQSLIEHSLACCLYVNATFYAERLHAICPNEDSLGFLAKCYYAQHKWKQVYLILQHATSTTNRYLFAVVCIELKKFKEAESALLASYPLENGVSFQTLLPKHINAEKALVYIPGGASGIYLLGKVARKQHQKEKAIEYLKLCLQMDSLMFCAINDLCELGIDLANSDFLSMDIETSLSKLSSMFTSDVHIDTHFAQFANPSKQLSGKKVSGLPWGQSKQFNNQSLIERISDTGNSPKTAISLGMSSLSFRVPFASPGSILSGTVNSTRFPSASLHASDLSGKALKSDSRQLDRSRYMHMNNSNATSDYHEANSKLNGTTLFEISSPALTPIQSQQSSFNIHSVISSQQEESMAMDLSLTPSIVPNDVNSNTKIVSQSISAIPLDKSNRRVSFGPKATSARLSFSTSGVEESEFEFHKDENEPELYPNKFPRTDGTPHPHRQHSSTPSQRSHVHTTKQSTSIAEEDISCAAEVITAMCSYFSIIVSCLNQFQCHKTIDLLHRLPKHHFETAYVHQLLGEAYFELNDYKASMLAYRQMLVLEPYHSSGIENLSTALWHLKREKELCALAQQVCEIDKFSPEVWCVVGNCFSLQREPESAIKFFSRALQIDPSFAYAHTLIGHEYVHNEDFENAISSYRQAILHNDRHYNAWYGLGAIYYRQERFELSEYHFRKAFAINPSSSVLSCYLAMVLHAQGFSSKSNEALQILSVVIERDPKNPQLRFQRAHILETLDELEEALLELEIVQQLAPKEPPVYSMLCRIHNKLGNTDEAIRNYHHTMHLDVKEGQALKMDMDNLDEPDLTNMLNNFLNPLLEMSS